MLGNVTISNTTLTVNVTNPITVANSITIANSTLTVLGNVTISNTTLTVNITNPITVANSVTIANQTLSVNIAGHDVATLSYIQTIPIGTGNIFDNTNISQIKVASVFVYNDSATPFTLSLQMSPTTTSADYVDDPSYSLIVIAGNSKRIITINRYALYFRLSYTTLAAVSVRIWYNGQR